MPWRGRVHDGIDDQLADPGLRRGQDGCDQRQADARQGRAAAGRPHQAERFRRIAQRLPELAHLVAQAGEQRGRRPVAGIGMR